jgi:hypothetical protein
LIGEIKMGLGVELMPKRRLKDINVFEVSFVDKAANGQKFLVFKRAGLGGDPMEDIENGDSAGSDKDGNSSRLAELSEMLEGEAKGRELVTKQGEDKIKDYGDSGAVNDNFLSDDDSKYIELQKEIDGLRVLLDELRMGLPIRKGLQETEDVRERKSPKDKTISLIKSREMRSKMTCAHAPNPTQWAKEILQDGN